MRISKGCACPIRLIGARKTSFLRERDRIVHYARPDASRRWRPLAEELTLKIQASLYDLEFSPSMAKLAMVFSSCLLTTHSALADENRATEPTQFKSHVSPFLQTHCAACHDEDLSEADLAVHDLAGDVGSAAELRRWEKILEMLSLELMPLSDEEQPSGREARRVIGWIHAELAKLGREPDLSRLETPRFGNRVPHEDLFSGKHLGPAFSPRDCGE